MKIKQFEDLPIWQEARRLSNLVYKISIAPRFKDFALRDQMRRSAVSISSNIAEGFERGSNRESNRELIQFLYIAKGSVGELRSQIYLAHDNDFVVERETPSLMQKCIELSKGINNFINYLKKSAITQYRHKEK